MPSEIRSWQRRRRRKALIKPNNPHLPGRSGKTSKKQSTTLSWVAIVKNSIVEELTSDRSGKPFSIKSKAQTLQTCTTHVECQAAKTLFARRKSWKTGSVKILREFKFPKDERELHLFSFSSIHLNRQHHSYLTTP